MAGLAETCSHIGALFHWVETAVRMRDDTTCTSVENKWIAPAPVMLNEIDFSTPKPSEYVNLNPHNAPQPPINKKQKVEPPTSREIQAFYGETATAVKKPVILSITGGFNGTFVQEQSTLPKVLEVYEPDNLTKSLDELISLAQSYPDESITETMIDNFPLLTLST